MIYVLTSTKQIITVGYLHKKSTGAVKRWQKRWFCLQNQNLVYYPSKTALDHVKDKEINLLTEVKGWSHAHRERMCSLLLHVENRFVIIVVIIVLARLTRADLAKIHE